MNRMTDTVTIIFLNSPNMAQFSSWITRPRSAGVLAQHRSSNSRARIPKRAEAHPAFRVVGNTLI
jgi:hypothetical protein